MLSQDRNKQSDVIRRDEFEAEIGRIIAYLKKSQYDFISIIEAFKSLDLESNEIDYLLKNANEMIHSVNDLNSLAEEENRLVPWVDWKKYVDVVYSEWLPVQPRHVIVHKLLKDMRDLVNFAYNLEHTKTELKNKINNMLGCIIRLKSITNLISMEGKR